MRILKPISKEKRLKNIEKIKHNFFVFDTETTKLEPIPKNFVFGVIYGWNFQKVIYTIQDFKNEFKKVKYKNKFIFAHNAEFDLLTIFGNLYKNLDSKAIFNGKFITATKDGVKFCDSLNIYPSSLEKIGEIVGLKKLDNQKVKTNKLTKKNITENDIKYCIRDCEIIFNALLEIFENVGAIKMTISSLAMFDFRQNYIKENLFYSDLVDEFYNSYYGGRTECFKMGETNANVYDINSLYPYIMEKIIFPDVRNLKKETKVSVEYLHYLLKNYEGMCKIKVFHKDSYFGFLPFRSDKLLFPIGTFETIVNFNELRFAIKHNIIDILNVEYVVYSNRMETIFKDFVNINYNLRVESKNELEKFIIKLKLNSLYGKFGQRMKYQSEYFEQIPFDIMLELDKTEKYYELKLFNEKRNDCFLILENEKYKNSFFSIPTFSSYITSEARIKLLQSLLDNEKNGVVYCDTDSVFLEGEFIGDIGKNLGQFKKENKTITEIRGLKNYCYYDLDKINPYMFHVEQLETIKGINKNSIKIKDNVYINTQYFKTKESLRRNKESGTKKVTEKNLSNIYDKRIILQDGKNTLPLNFNN